MYMRVLFLSLLCIFATACSKGSGMNVIAYAEADPIQAQPIAPPVPIDPVRVYPDFDAYIIVGDSIMVGWPANLTMAALLVQEENVPATNVSRSGQTMGNANADGVAGAVNYLTAHGRGKDSVAVVVELAHNDWFISGGLDVFYDDYLAFLDGIEDDGLTNIYVFCVVPVASRWDYDHRLNNLNESYDDVRDMVRQVAATGKCDIIETGDWYTESDVWTADMFFDGLHLGPGGHRVYKDRLMEALRISK